MADTSFIIDIAAEFDSAATTSAQLDELSQSLISAGADAEAFESAIIQAGHQIDDAARATAAANAALADGNKHYAELQRAATAAAKAVQKAGAKGVIDPALARESFAAAHALEAFTPALTHLKREAADAAKAQAKLVTTQNSLKALSTSAKGAFSEQAAAAKKSVKEAEGMVPLVKNFNDLGDALGSSEGRAVLAAGAFVGVATAVAAITVAVAAGTIALASWAVGLADAKREAALTAEAAEALSPGLVELRGDFAALSELASASELRGWVKQLDEAKVSATQLPDALRAVAQSSAVMGQEGVNEFFSRLKDAKGEAGALSAEVSKKLGGIVERKLMGLGAQSARLKKNIGEIFSGLNIEPVLEGFRVLVELFDKNTAAGEAMKFLFESVFQPLIDQATNAAYVIEAFALGFLIGMTKLYIGLKPVIKGITEFFGFEDPSLADTLDLAKRAGELIAPVFAGFVVLMGAVVAAVALAGAAILAIPASLYALQAALQSAGEAVGKWIIGAWNEAKAFLEGINLTDIGTNIMLGLANGISAGASRVVSAITGSVGEAIKSAKSALGIASPSKVFADIGGYTAEGFANGIDDNAGLAQDAMASMVEPPAPGELSSADALSGNASGSGGAAPGKGARGTPTVHIENLYLAGKKASKAEAEALSEALTRLIEGDAAALAGDAPADEDAA